MRVRIARGESRLSRVHMSARELRVIAARMTPVRHKLTEDDMLEIERCGAPSNWAVRRSSPAGFVRDVSGMSACRGLTTSCVGL